MTVLVALGVGFLAARLVWLALRPVFATGLFARDNYRGHSLPTAVGLVIAVAVLGVEGARIVLGVAFGQASLPPGGPRVGVLVLVVTMALLGLIDDLAGDSDQRGFRGHGRALAQGRLTTGALKLLGGGAAAVVAVVVSRPTGAEASLGFLIADSALVALAANTGNLFDRAPGRAIKISALAFFLLVAANGLTGGLVAFAIVVGGALALLLDDLHERVMLGDTGANLLGAVLGLAVVTTGSPVTRLGVLGVLAILNGISEYVSFGRVIDRFPPLRMLDRAGRRSP